MCVRQISNIDLRENVRKLQEQRKPHQNRMQTMDSYTLQQAVVKMYET